jgi:hypothetical protein
MLLELALQVLQFAFRHFQSKRDKDPLANAAPPSKGLSGEHEREL